MLNFLRAHKLATVLILAAIVRLTLLIAFSSIFDFARTGAVHGSGAYDTYAQNLLATGVYGIQPTIPDATIPPLYSYVLAALYSVFGRGYLQVGVFHIVLDLASITCMYHLCKRLFASPYNEIIGALAGVFYALYPYLVFQNLTLIDTPLFMALLYSFLLLMALLRERPRFDRAAWMLALLGGLALGLSMLVRPVLPVLALLVALWFVFRLTFRQTLIRLLPVAIIAALTLVPWIARNYAVYDAFVPMTTTSGANFWQGNSEYTVRYLRAGYDVQWTSPDELQSADPASREADAERFALALTYLREHPEAIPELLWTKFVVYWSIDVAPRFNPTEGQLPRLDYQGNVIVEGGTDSLELGGLPPGDPAAEYSTPLFDQVGRWLHRVYFGGLLLLAISGIVLSRKLWREVSLLWFAQISMTLVYVVLHPSTRYRVPTDPLLFAFSAYALLWLWGWYSASRRTPAQEASANT